MSSVPHSAETVRFADWHAVPLEAGEYRLSVTQAFDLVYDKDDHIGGKDVGGHRETHSVSGARLAFSVAAPRFRLPPDAVSSVYPEDGSSADLTGVLPQVLLTRDTLPWERTALAEARGDRPPPAPWLAVLTFTAREWARVTKPGRPAPASQTKVYAEPPPAPSGDAQSDLTISDLRTTPTGVAYPSLVPETGEHGGDLVQVIDVPGDIAAAICPRLEDLRWLCHARQSETAVGVEERAVVVSARAVAPPADPATPETHICCLVSVEGRWDGLPQPNAPHPLPTDGAPSVRFVVLHRWRFHCTAEAPDLAETFTEMVSPDAGGPETDRHDVAFRLPADAVPATVTDPAVLDRLAAGYVPVQHHARDGSRSGAWYRGPLLPLDAPRPDAHALPLARAADELAPFDAALGMWDVSYAAAWELGRLLALRDRAFADRLLRWRARHRLATETHRQVRTHGHLAAHPAALAPPEADDLADELRTAPLIASLGRLERIPWRYLVPDERLLPLRRDPAQPTKARAGTFRAFAVDPMWLAALRDGAFAVGRLLGADHTADATLRELHGSAVPSLFGFLLRGPIVKAWPTLVCQAVVGDDHVTALRVSRPSPTVLLALFELEEAPSAFTIHPPPQTMHFGLDHDHDDQWTRVVRDPASGEVLSGAGGDVRVTVPFRDSASLMVDVVRLSETVEEALRTAESPRGPLAPHTLALALFDAPDLVQVTL